MAVFVCGFRLRANEFGFMSEILYQEVSASFTLPYVEVLWEGLVQESAQLGSDEAVSGDSRLLVFGPALSDGADDRIAHLVIHTHDREEKIHDGEAKGDSEEQGEKKSLHGVFALRPKPSTEPPDVVKKKNDALGGRSGLIRILERVAPPKWIRSALFRVQCVLSRDDWTCNILPTVAVSGSRYEAALRLGAPAYLEHVRYRYENGVNGLSEVAIEYGHEEREYEMTLRGKGLMRFESERWLPYADDLLTMAIAAFFEPIRNAEGKR